MDLDRNGDLSKTEPVVVDYDLSRKTALELERFDLRSKVTSESLRKQALKHLVGQNGNLS